MGLDMYAIKFKKAEDMALEDLMEDKDNYTFFNVDTDGYYVKDLVKYGYAKEVICSKAFIDNHNWNGEIAGDAFYIDCPNRTYYAIKEDEELGYWRKAYVLNQYIQDNYGEVDNCGYLFLTKEDWQDIVQGIKEIFAETDADEDIDGCITLEEKREYLFYILKSIPKEDCFYHIWY